MVGRLSSATNTADCLRWQLLETMGSKMKGAMHCGQLAAAFLQRQYGSAAV